MSNEQEKQGPGRPASDEYKGIVRKPVTTLWPEDILTHIKQVSHNRTKWLIEAAREKMEREQNEFLEHPQTGVHIP